MRRVLEESEYGDDPAVDRRSRNAQFGEDRVHVLLHCRFGQEQGLLDACIGLALGHLAEDVQLARSQGGYRARGACLLSRDQNCDRTPGGVRLLGPLRDGHRLLR